MRQGPWLRFFKSAFRPPSGQRDASMTLASFFQIPFSPPSGQHDASRTLASFFQIRLSPPARPTRCVNGVKISDEISAKGIPNAPPP